MALQLQQIWDNEEARRRLMSVLQAWNRARSSGDAAQQLLAAEMLNKLLAGSSTRDLRQPQQTVERLLDFPSHRLAVYGSLAPGKKNHHMMAGMEGTWRKATLRGTLHNAGWGAGQGFPGFAWDGTDTPIAAQVFTSRDLPDHWQRLDDFEGPEYRRTLVPVEILPQQAKVGLPPHQAKGAPVGDPGLAGDPEIENGEIKICNVYELSESP